MILKNGMGNNVAWASWTIKREASQEGDTSIVIAICDDETEVSISQHESSGDWDVAVNEEHDWDFPDDEGEDAVEYFMRLCQKYNGKGKKK